MRIPLIAAGLALASCVTPTGQGSAEIKIATWNLEFLAEQDGAGCKPRQQADYDKLAAYAEQLDADVVGFQEVESEVAARRVFPADRYEIVMSGQPYLAKQDACNGEPAGRTWIPQRTGFAIRKGVPYRVNAPLETLNVSANPARPVRWGVDVTIQGGTELRLLDVHLKSGCSSGAKADDPDCPTLFSQVPVVEGWIDAREREGVAFVVLGDFNRRLDLDDAEVWRAWNDGDPAGLKLATASTAAAGGLPRPKCDNGRWDDFIDHIVLNERAAARYQPDSFHELVYSETGDAMPSDHCPIRVTLAQ